jgi:uncharacterized protein YdaU (DUF1376 family)
LYYYSFHIGDYSAHTKHLTPMEDLAYRRLLDACCVGEGPLRGKPAESLGSSLCESMLKLSSPF